MSFQGAEEQIVFEIHKKLGAYVSCLRPTVSATAAAAINISEKDIKLRKRWKIMKMSPKKLQPKGGKI